MCASCVKKSLSVCRQRKRVVKFLREHHYSLFLWREKAAHELLNPGDTRFATNFIMSGQLQKEKDAGAELAADRRYMQWLNGTLPRKKQRAKGYKAEGLWVKSKLQDPDWWEKGEMILGIVSPIIELLRLADSELPLMGKVYHRMSAIATQLDDTEFAPGLTQRQRSDLVKIHADRWSYLHNFYHAAGFALDPEFSKEKVFDNAEVSSESPHHRARGVPNRHIFSLR